MDILNFPNEPNIGDTFHRWRWDGSKWAMRPSGGASRWSTGDVKLTLKKVADDGWVMMDDGTIGNDESGATHRGDKFAALFNLLYDNLSDDTAPLFNSAGTHIPRVQIGLASAWATGYRILLTYAAGRALAVAGSGAGLTPRRLGMWAPETNAGGSWGETHQLTTAQLAPHAHGVSDPTHNHDVGDPSHWHGVTNIITWASNIGVSYASPDITLSFAHANTAFSSTQGAHTGIWFGGAHTGIGIYGNGADWSHNNMQPTTFVNAMIKL